MKSRTDPRLKVLRGLRRERHRYDPLRALGQSISLAVLLLVPLSGLARVDLIGQRHALFFRPADLRPALAGVVVAIGALYVITFLSNVAAGRLFCGWGCPVGQLCRFGEAVDVPSLSQRQRLRAQAEGAAFSLALVLSFLAWWVDLRSLWRGPWPQGLLVWALLLVGIFGAYGHGRGWRWEFCKSACPIGLYYSFVSPARWYGVHFRNQHETCIECDACDHVCPVDLEPRDLYAPVARPGVSISDAPGRNHCLECGDCIRACEWMVGMKGLSPPPLLLGYYRGPQRIDRLREGEIDMEGARAHG